MSTLSIMTDDRKAGIALIAGSLGGILTMAIHPIWRVERLPQKAGNPSRDPCEILVDFQPLEVRMESSVVRGVLDSFWGITLARPACCRAAYCRAA
jgi:hypothetical protein